MINTEKGLVAFITLLSIICLSSGASAASTNISIGSATVSPGDTTTLDVMINNVANAGAVTFNLTYNPTIVQVTAASNGDFDTTTPALHTAANGYIRLTAYQGGSPGLNGDVLVTTLTLQAMGAGTSGLNFIDPTEVSDNTPDQNDIDIDLINGTFIVTAPVEPVLCTAPDPPSHDFGDVLEGQARIWTFDITNCGTGTLIWGVIDDQPWIGVNPIGGTTTTETDMVTVTIDTTGLSLGPHIGTIIAMSNDGDKEGIITVNVVAAPTPPPVAVPVLSGIGMIALIAALAVVLAISVSSATRRRKK